MEKLKGALTWGVLPIGLLVFALVILSLVDWSQEAKLFSVNTMAPPSDVMQRYFGPIFLVIAFVFAALSGLFLCLAHLYKTSWKARRMLSFSIMIVGLTFGVLAVLSVIIGPVAVVMLEQTTVGLVR